MRRPPQPFNRTASRKVCDLFSPFRFERPALADARLAALIIAGATLFVIFEFALHAASPGMATSSSGRAPMQAVEEARGGDMLPSAPRRPAARPSLERAPR